MKIEYARPLFMAKKLQHLKLHVPNLRIPPLPYAGSGY